MKIPHIDNYWSKKFGLEPDELYQAGMYVVPHARPWEDTLAYVFVRDSTCVMSVASQFVEKTRERVRNRTPRTMLREIELQTLFDQRIERTVGPSYQGYAEVKDFIPRSSELVRKLATDDNERLRQFKGACETIAWERSGIDRTNSALFGCFTEAGVVAIGHYSMWDDNVASIGVLTHPAYRNRDYGKYVVSAAMSDAFEHGYVVLYQTLTANESSVALATSLGCQDYARTVAVHLIQ